jgi:hypothetical protein
MKERVYSLARTSLARNVAQTGNWWKTREDKQFAFVSNLRLGYNLRTVESVPDKQAFFYQRRDPPDQFGLTNNLAAALLPITYCLVGTWQSRHYLFPITYYVLSIAWWAHGSRAISGGRLVLAEVSRAKPGELRWGVRSCDAALKKGHRMLLSSNPVEYPVYSCQTWDPMSYSACQIRKLRPIGLV